MGSNWKSCTLDNNNVGNLNIDNNDHGNNTHSKNKENHAKKKKAWATFPIAFKHTKSLTYVYIAMTEQPSQAVKGQPPSGLSTRQSPLVAAAQTKAVTAVYGAID